MADPLLVARLVEALLHARHQLLLLNRFQVTDMLDRIPAELKDIFWEANNDAVLDVAADALEQAAAAGFIGPDVLEPPEQAAKRPRLVVDNDS